MNLHSDYEYVSYTIDTHKYNQSRVNKKDVQTKQANYSILNYDRNYVCHDDIVTPLYRSIVLSSKNNDMLSFSPPKSIELDVFMNKNPTIHSKIWINEKVEGTMVNLFYDDRIQSWEISTKGSVGGNCWYYRTEYDNPKNNDKLQSKQMTFREMFLDVFRNIGESQINEIAFLECLPKHYTYSFVLQHPSNHIVLPIKDAKLYLVALYEITDNRAIYIPPCIYEEWDCFLNMHGIIDFPIRYNENSEFISYNIIRANHCSIQSRYDKMGVMFMNMETGERASMKNPVYEEVKQLRGNNPNLEYQYLCLLRIGKTGDFLTYFPMYKHNFDKFRDQYNDFVSNVHKSYVTKYIQKNNIAPISKKYNIHVWRLHHQMYLPSLSTGSTQIITRHVVKQYFDEMEPRSMLYYLHYEDRQRIETEL